MQVVRWWHLRLLTSRLAPVLALVDSPGEVLAKMAVLQVFASERAAQSAATMAAVKMATVSTQQWGTFSLALPPLPSPDADVHPAVRGDFPGFRDPGTTPGSRTRDSLSMGAMG